MDNYQYGELKDSIQRINELEDQVNTLKQLILDSVSSSGHFNLNRTNESFLWSKIGD